MGTVRSRLALLWLAGVSLRLTVLAVPPILPIIHHQLHLDQTTIGALTGLPVFLLALVAVPGSLMVARLGARRALLLGLMTIAVGGAIRGVGSQVAVLFAGTLLMGAGIAICQPCMPTLVRSWLPGRIGIATATFSNGMLIGEILPVAIMGPFLIGGLGGWQSALAFWSIPVVATAAAIWLLSENEPVEADHAPAKWWPNWRDSRVWLLGLTLGGASAAYWAANAFIPELLKHEHHGAYITAALTALNVAQLPASFIVAAWPQRLVARRWPLIAAGILIVLAAAGILAFPPVWSVVAAGCLGLASAWIFVLTLALPPMLAEAGDTHRVSAAMFTISYTCPFLGGVIGGALWDATGISQTAFVALFAGGLLVALAPIRFNLSETRLALHSSPVVPIAPTP